MYRVNWNQIYCKLLKSLRVLLPKETIGQDEKKMWLYKKWKKHWFLAFDGKKTRPRNLFGPQGENMFQCLFQIQPRRIMKKEELLIVRPEIMEVKALQEEKLKVQTRNSSTRWVEAIFKMSVPWTFRIEFD